MTDVNAELSDRTGAAALCLDTSGGQKNHISMIKIPNLPLRD